MTRATIAAAALVVALLVAGAAQAAGGWHFAQRSYDSSSFSTDVDVDGEGLVARLTIRATKGNRVTTGGEVACRTADYSRSVSREVPAVRATARGVYATPIRRTFAPTFAGAASCSFSLYASSGAGTLRATLEVRP